jgi:hypothetical protein
MREEVTPSIAPAGSTLIFPAQLRATQLTALVPSVGFLHQLPPQLVRDLWAVLISRVHPGHVGTDIGWVGDALDPPPKEQKLAFMDAAKFLGTLSVTHPHPFPTCLLYR